MKYRDLSSRLADIANSTSSQTAATYAGKSVFTSHTPYVLETVGDTTVVVFTYHFIKGLRRLLAGDVITGDEQLSTYELGMYSDYVDYLDGIVFTGTKADVLQELDLWLTGEIQEETHAATNREYSEEHPWRHTEERGVKLWQAIF